MKDVLKYLTPICLIYLFYQLITPLTFSIAGIKPNLPDILLWTGWHTTILKMFLSSYILMMWADKKLTTNKTNSLNVYVVVATLFHLSDNDINDLDFYMFVITVLMWNYT